MPWVNRIDHVCRHLCTIIMYAPHPSSSCLNIYWGGDRRELDGEAPDGRPRLQHRRADALHEGTYVRARRTWWFDSIPFVDGDSPDSPDDKSINPLPQAAKQAVCEMALKEVAPEQYARYFPPPGEDDEEGGGEDEEDEREQYIDGAHARPWRTGKYFCD